MKEEIEEIIKKNLPAQVGETLQERLKQADVDEKKLKEAEITINELEKDIEVFNKKLRDQAELEELEESLRKLKEELVDKEKKLDIEKLKYQLAAEIDKTSFSKEVALGLVRNTTYRNQVYKNKNTPNLDQYGGQIGSSIETEDTTTIQTQE